MILKMISLTVDRGDTMKKIFEIGLPDVYEDIVITDKNASRIVYESLGATLPFTVTDITEKTTRRDANLVTLRKALVELVGVSGKAELEAMELAMRLAPAPMADKATAIDAIHALLATMEDGA